VHAGSGKVALLSMQCRMPVDQFQKALELATYGCAQVHRLLRAQLQATTAHELKAKGIKQL
jgi:ribonuclease PH